MFCTDKYVVKTKKIGVKVILEVFLTKYNNTMWITMDQYGSYPINLNLVQQIIFGKRGDSYNIQFSFGKDDYKDYVYGTKIELKTALSELSEKIGCNLTYQEKKS